MDIIPTTFSDRGLRAVADSHKLTILQLHKSVKPTKEPFLKLQVAHNTKDSLQFRQNGKDETPRLVTICLQVDLHVALL